MKQPVGLEFEAFGHLVTYPRDGRNLSCYLLLPEFAAGPTKSLRPGYAAFSSVSPRPLEPRHRAVSGTMGASTIDRYSTARFDGRAGLFYDLPIG
ncbi:MAG: hypothetical protein R3A46_12380 [Thermomicrobiales bacterium]